MSDAETIQAAVDTFAERHREAIREGADYIRSGSTLESGWQRLRDAHFPRSDTMTRLLFSIAVFDELDAGDRDE
jgi:hypothetical protein